MVNITLKGINKKFGEVVAAGHINLEIKHGEFFTFWDLAAVEKPPL